MVISKRRAWMIGVLGVFGCLVLIWILATRNPQPGLVVAGVVTDAATGEPIVGAKVSDDGYGVEPYKAGVTDAAGRYQFTTWAEEHGVIAEAARYKPQRKVLTTGFFGSDTEKTVNFSLEQE